jgi:hypothetical protein
MSAGKHANSGESKKGRRRPEEKPNGKSAKTDVMRVGTVVETRSVGRSARKKKGSYTRKEVDRVGTVVETRGAGIGRSK